MPYFVGVVTVPERVLFLARQEVVNQRAGRPSARVDGPMDRDSVEGDIDGGRVGLYIVALFWVGAEVEGADDLLGGVMLMDWWAGRCQQTSPEDGAKSNKFQHDENLGQHLAGTCSVSH